MKISNLFIGFILLLATSCAQAGSLNDAQQLDNAGLPQLAWQQVEQHKSGGENGVDEVGWQRLQWQLLTQIGKPEDILAQAQTLAKDSPDDVRQTAYLLAAHAAMTEGDGVVARSYLRRLLWDLPLDKAQYPELRAMVVQSHWLPQPDAEAASLMLRYQQEFGPSQALLHAYALALLQSGHPADRQWVRTQLPDNDPLAVLIDASSGQLSDSDLKQRLQVLLKDDSDSAPVLLILRKIAAPLNAPALQMQIDERLLNLTLPPTEVNAPLLWKTYRNLTQSFGNVRLLLFGSDTGWADLARTSSGTDPAMARAIWAYLARDAKDTGLRSEAQQQLLEQLLVLHLDRTALRLFESAWPGLPPQAFNPVVRYRLGLLALQADKYALAAGLWRDLAALPEGVDKTEWAEQRALLFARTGDRQTAASAVSAWLDQGGSMESASGWPMLLLTGQLTEHKATLHDAQSLLVRMQADAEPLQQRAIFYRLAQIAAAQQQPLQAARLFMQAATVAPQADAFAWQARLDAAANLDIAGLKEDAARQYQMVAKLSTDPAQQAQANYALATR